MAKKISQREARRKLRVINVTDIYHVEALVRDSEKLTWEFWSKKQKIRLHLPYWYLEYLAQELWKAVEAQERRATNSRRAMERNSNG